MMNEKTFTRRQIVGGMTLAASGLFLPSSLEKNIEWVRRFWALDRTMVAARSIIGRDGYLIIGGGVFVARQADVADWHRTGLLHAQPVARESLAVPTGVQAMTSAIEVREEARVSVPDAVYVISLAEAEAWHRHRGGWF